MDFVAPCGYGSVGVMDRHFAKGAAVTNVNFLPSVVILSLLSFLSDTDWTKEKRDSESLRLFFLSKVQ